MLAQRKNETLMQYWLSFSPAAPFFGVPWRFEALLPGATFFRPSAVAAQVTAGVAEETARAAEETVARAATEAETAAEQMEVAAETAQVEPEAGEAEPEADVPVNGTPKPFLYAEPPAEIDDLKQIKGVGPKLETLLHELGVYRFEQIARFSEADLAWIDDHLTTFKGRPLRDDWPSQAKALM